jgi:glyoxylase-like metal-dependent hydrolase (beta-lactamase superfamily II)
VGGAHGGAAVLTVVAVVGASTGAWAAEPAAAPPPPKLEPHKLTDTITLITGPGGNIAVLVGKDYAVVVDDQVKQLTPELKKTIAGITTKPVRFVLNTHWHGDHTGGNAVLAGDGAVIIAHDNVRKRLSTDQFNAIMKEKMPALPPAAWPVVTFADSISLHVGDEDIDVIHVVPAHTDGDSIVWFKKSNVIHMGDTLFSNGYPFIDVGSGGSLDGYIKVADQVLALALPTTKIIPGHGPVADKLKLKAFRDMLTTVRDRFKKAAAAGKSVAELKAANPLADLDATWGHAFINGGQFVEWLYPVFAPKR